MKIHRPSICLVVLSLVHGLPSSQLGDIEVESILLGTGDQHQFGSSVDADGVLVISGSPNSDAHGTASGQARAYELDLFDYYCTFCWQSNGNLAPYDSPDGDQFGHGVAIDGDRMVIGAAFEQSEEHDNSGRVYVYQRNGGTWELETTLTPNIFQFVSDVSGFGQSVAISGDTIAVSAKGSSLPFGGSTPEAVYVFRHTGSSWAEEETLRPSNTNSGIDFGIDVAISGDTIAVAAPGWTKPPGGFGNLDWGAVFLFERNQAHEWRETGMLIPAQGSPSDKFAEKIALDGDLVAIAAWGDSGNTGAVYRGERTGNSWALTDKLTVPGAHPSLQLGHSVGVSGDRILAGARFDAAAPGSAAGYVFEGAAIHPLPSASVDTNSTFYQSGAIDGDRAILGSWQSSFNFSGQAHTYEWDGAAWQVTTHLPAGDATGSFAWDVDVSGSDALVGARLAVGLASGSGLVDHYEDTGSGHVLGQRFLGNDTMAGDRFGAAVSMHENRAAVGAPHDDVAGPDSGSVYPFESFGFAFSSGSPGKFVGSDTQAGDAFGSALALHGTRVLVGAPFHDGVGEVYVFEHDGSAWSETATIGQAGAGLGTVLALEGDTALLGTPDTEAGGAVQVWVHDAGSWSLEETLVSDDLAAADLFGASVSLYGERAAVGAPGAAGSGAVYLFARDNGSWTQTHKLLHDDAAAGDLLGSSVDLRESRLLAGAPGKNPDGMNSGAAYAFYECGTEWIQRERFVHSAATGDDLLGASVAASEWGTFVGSPEHDNASPFNPLDETGAVLVFRQRPSSLPRLYFDFDSASLATGPNAEFNVCLGDEFAGDYYAVLGSTGFFPGIDLFGVHLDLNPDAYFMLSLLNKPPFQDSVGLLGSDGTGAGTYDLPPIGGIGFGIQVRHLALALDPSTLTATHVTDVQFFFLEP